MRKLCVISARSEKIYTSASVLGTVSHTYYAVSLKFKMNDPRLPLILNSEFGCQETLDIEATSRVRRNNERNDEVYDER